MIIIMPRHVLAFLALSGCNLMAEPPRVSAESGPCERSLDCGDGLVCNAGECVSYLEPPAPKAPETFVEAREAYRPLMTDTMDEMSEGAALFAYWAVDGLDWGDLSFDNETTYKAFMKDPASERGKRLCVSGRIVQIRREPLADRSSFNGILASRAGDVAVFFAVGSTGDLNTNSKARFCGVATGTYAYSNKIGGSSEGISMVGMFDLPENRSK